MTEPEPLTYYLPNWPVSEADMRALAAGTVPEWLSEKAREMVEWSLQSGPVSYVGLAETRQRRKA